MKKTSILVLTLLAIFAFASGKSASAAETTLKPNVAYAEDFEGYAVDANHDEVYQAKGLFWFDSSMISAKVVDRDGDKQIKYTIENFNGTYSTLGGIGSGAIGNLVKLVDGQKYHFSMYVDTTNVAAGSTLWIEYQETNWVGAKIVNGEAMVAGPGCQAANLSYVNNVLEFDIVGYDFGSNMDRGYIKLTAINAGASDVIVVDDFSITEVIDAAVVRMDYEGKEAGSNAHDTPMIYAENFTSMTFEQEEGNGYLKFTQLRSKDAYSKFYFNRLPVTSDVEYRLDVDIEFVSDYNCFYFGYDACQYEYQKDGTYNGAQAGERLGETSWDGNHLSVVFTPSDSLGQWWPQVWFVFALSDADLEVKFDNLVIAPTTSLVSAKSLSATVVEPRLCVGEELSAEDFAVTLTRNNDLSRVLAADEYTIDASQVNKDATGEYPVTITAVDEFGGEVSTTVNVNYVDHVWGEGVETTPATPDSEGVMTYTCECSATKEEAIAKLPKMVTIYFQNNWHWGNVRIYLWNDKGSNAEWPGVALNLIGTCGAAGDIKDLYTFEFDANLYTSFIISGEEKDWDPSNNRNKTADLSVSTYLAGLADNIHYLNNDKTLGSYPYSAEENLHLHDLTAYASDANNHWHQCSCGLKAADAVNEAHTNEVKYENGYKVEYCTVCGHEASKVANLTYVVTNCNDATKNVPGHIELNENAYSTTLTLAAWDVVTLYYNGAAISSETVTMVNGTAWNGGAWAGVVYPFYHDGNTTGFISPTGGDYNIAYNATENSLLLGEYIEPLPEGAHKVAVNNADAGGNQIAVFVTAGDVIRNNSGAYPHHLGEWDPYRLFIVIDSKGRVAYMCLMPIKGYGNPYEGSYARHSVYANYRENPAFANLSDEYEGKWGITVDWSLVVPEGGYVISAHGDAATAIGKAILNNPDFVGTDNYEYMVNSKTINVDNIIVTYNTEKNYLLVESHEHVASAEWAKDDNHHWHVCSTCELVMDDKAEHAWGEGEVTTAPTCTEAGVKTFACECGATKEEAIDAKGHTEVDDAAVEATCTEAGKTAGKHCSVCNEVTVPQTEVPALGHKDEDGDHKCDACEADLSTDKPSDEPTEEPSDKPTEEPKKGCGGSVIASIFGVLALAGSVVVLRKKREE